MIMRMCRILACVFIPVSLACCGGGGGGGGSGGGGGGAPLAMPSAGVLGAVLVANAADLRPLADGARYDYHGQQFASSGAVSTLYDSSVIDTANADGSFAEASHFVFQSDGSAGVSIQGGQVLNQTLDPFQVGSNSVVTAVELRSPVQVNDQYVQWQGTGVDVGDVDGDGKDDSADILAYGTVIGEEPVALPQLGRTVNAVRVDSTFLVRVTLSSTGQTMPVQTSVQSTWYAAGIGIVRERSTAPSASGPGPVKYDEVLYAWNGIGAGLGAIGPMSYELPQALWCCGSAEYLPSTLTAAAIGNEAMLIGKSNSNTTPESLTASVYTNTGVLLRVAELPNMGAFGASSRLYPIGASTALLVGIQGNVGGSTLVNLQVISDAPATVGPVTTVTLPTTNSYVATAWDGQALWVMWGQTYQIAGAQLMLQPFDQNGQPLAAPQVLDTTGVGFMGATNIVGSNGSALLTWATANVSGTTYHYASIAGYTATAHVFTLGMGGQGYTGSIDSIDAPRPVLGTGVAALLWRGPLFSYSATGPLPETAPRGVRLDAAFQPVRSTTGSLDGETLPTTWEAPGQPMVAGAVGGRVVAAGYAYQQQVPYSGSTPDLLFASSVTPGQQSLATASQAATTFGVAGMDWNLGLSSEMPNQILLWPDRALVVGESQMTLVWLN